MIAEVRPIDEGCPICAAHEIMMHGYDPMEHPFVLNQAQRILAIEAENAALKARVAELEEWKYALEDALAIEHDGLASMQIRDDAKKEASR